MKLQINKKALAATRAITFKGVHMNNLIIQNNESLTMSSREIADLTGKRHDHVLRDIRKMTDNPSLGFESKGGIYKPDGTNRNYKLIYLPRRSCDLLVMSYSVEIQAKMYDRWQELESKPVHQIPQTLSQALMLAANQAEQIEKQEEALKLAAPKVEFVDRFVESTGNKTFREVAKLLKANEREFRAFLVSSQVMYKLNNSWTARAQHLNAKRFSESSGEKNGRAFFECKFTPKGVEYIAGKWISHKEVK